jgi:hypothetical protein
MSAWMLVLDRVRIVHERTDWVLHVFQTHGCVALYGDDGDATRIMGALKGVLRECALLDDFSEATIQFVALRIMVDDVSH